VAFLRLGFGVGLWIVWFIGPVIAVSGGLDECFYFVCGRVR